MALIRPLDPLDLSGVAPVTPTTVAAENAQQAQSQMAQLKVAQEQQAQQRQQSFRSQLSGLASRPSSAAYTQLLMQYPEFAEGLTPVIKQMGTQEQAKASAAFQAQALEPYMALLNNRPDLAMAKLGDLAKAQDNAGSPEEAAKLRAMVDTIRKDPKVAAGVLGGQLMGHMGQESYDALMKHAGFFKEQEKKTVEISEIEARRQKQIGETLTEGERADRALNSTADRKDAEVQAEMRRGLMGAQTNQANTGAAANTAQAGLAQAQTGRVNDLRPYEVSSAASKATSDAAAALNASVLEKARADRAVAEAKTAGAVPPELLRQQAEAETQVRQAAAEYARPKAAAEASSAQSKADMDKFTVANAPAELDRSRQRQLLEIRKLEQQTGPEATVALEQAKANLRKTEQDIVNSVNEQNVSWERVKTDQANTKLREKELDATLSKNMAEAQKLPDLSLKNITDKTDASVKARDTIRTTEDLVKRVDAHLGGLGWTAETLKSAVNLGFGFGDKATETRQAYSRFLMDSVLTQVPPGSLTEAEQRIIREGFPTQYQSPYLIKSYLMAARKASLALIRGNNRASEWITRNKGNPAIALQNMTVEGKPVPAGMPFETFSRMRELELKGGE